MSSPPSLGIRARESHRFELGGSFAAILIGNHVDYEGDPANRAANLNPIGKDKNRIGTRTGPIRPTSPDSD